MSVAREFLGENTMRTMYGRSQGEEGTINVVEHLITRNLWEYYIIDDPEDVNAEGYVTALIVDDHPIPEIRSVYMSSITNDIISRTTQLYDKDLLAAPNWEWWN